MVKHQEAVWLNPGFTGSGVHRRFTEVLRQGYPLREWILDDRSGLCGDLESVFAQLQADLGPGGDSIHLIGHGMGGILAWRVARRLPGRVRSVTMLGVGPIPAINWQTYWMMMRHRSLCSGGQVMAHLVRLLVGPQRLPQARDWMRLLEQELATSLPPIAFLHSTPLAQDHPLSMPVLIGGGAEDLLVSSAQMGRWRAYLKPQDRAWICPGGPHFFHITAPQRVSDQVVRFWQRIDRGEIFLKPRLRVVAAPGSFSPERPWPSGADPELGPKIPPGPPIDLTAPGCP